ncbi:MAG: hypothetical protein EOO65_02330 [Methanosarcinales archaeon]|nr:MAG: hypothetical protein EOO65_02330 [Methanosarcinales archaeon]
MARELSLLAVLHHPGFIACKGMHVVPEEGVAIIAFELAHYDLAAVLRDISIPIPLATVRAWMKQLLEGLVHMHERGWVHRDLKPSNILLLPVAKPAGSSSGTAASTASVAATSSTAHRPGMTALGDGGGGVQQPPSPGGATVTSSPGAATFGNAFRVVITDFGLAAPYAQLLFQLPSVSHGTHSPAVSRAVGMVGAVSSADGTHAVGSKRRTTNPESEHDNRKRNRIESDVSDTACMLVIRRQVRRTSRGVFPKARA